MSRICPWDRVCSCLIARLDLIDVSDTYGSRLDNGSWTGLIGRVVRRVSGGSLCHSHNLGPSAPVQ